MRRLKGERRAERHRKTKHAPKGGTRGGQLVRMRVAKGYAGSAKRFIRGALSHDGAKRFIRGALSHDGAKRFVRIRKHTR